MTAKELVVLFGVDTARELAAAFGGCVESIPTTGAVETVNRNMLLTKYATEGRTVAEVAKLMGMTEAAVIRFIKSTQN